MDSPQKGRNLLAALTTIFLALFVPIALAQTNSDAMPNTETVSTQWKTELEIKKLTLEINSLQKSHLSEWLVPILSLAGVILAAGVSYAVAKRTHAAALDQTTHEERLACYPKLVGATAPFAIYFPNEKSNGMGSITPLVCLHVGQALSNWYFKEGGLLLSTKARDAYFELTHALLGASKANRLAVPKYPDDSLLIGTNEVNQYRKALGFQKVGEHWTCPDGRHWTFQKVQERWTYPDVRSWTFGAPKSDMAAEQFRDYVFLQTVSSQLRTQLSEDIRGRRLPA